MNETNEARRAYIACYRRDEPGVTCTNVVMARSTAEVAARYADCRWLHIHEAKPYEVEEMRRRACPVFEAGRD